MKKTHRQPLPTLTGTSSTTLSLIPNHLLTDAQKALGEREVGMPEGRLQMNVRKALAHYTLQRYQAAITEQDAKRVRKHPLQLVSRD